MERYFGFIIIGIAILVLIFIFRQVLKKKGSSKGLIFWIITSASIGIITPYLSQIKEPIVNGTNEIYTISVNIVFFLLTGFVALLITAIWNGILYGKWKVTQGE